MLQAEMIHSQNYLKQSSIRFFYRNRLNNLGLPPMSARKTVQHIETASGKENLTTRIGTITLRVPRHRNGDFSTSMFERYQ